MFCFVWVYLFWVDSRDLFIHSLQWRHNERDGVPNHRCLDCLLNRFIGTDQRKHHRSIYIIGLSETWLNETNKDVYNLDGCNHIPLVRPDRIHGGVSLFISASISYRILKEISIVNKDIECLMTEIDLHRFTQTFYSQSHVRISWPYVLWQLRTPNK